MDPDDTPLLVIGCRFGMLSFTASRWHPLIASTVPYDRWFMTHLDSSWRINQVKHWLVSKCNLIPSNEGGTPTLDLDLPRFRPISPITFATTKRTQGSLDTSMEDKTDRSDEEDFEEGSEKTSTESLEYSYYSYHGGNGKRPRTAGSQRTTTRPSTSGSEIHSRQSVPHHKSSSTVQRDHISMRYTLISFSTGNILEDDFVVSWYKLRPFELLEIHLSGSVVNLPREVMMDYVEPYFEAGAKMMRMIWSEREGNHLGIRRKKDGSTTTSMESLGSFDAGKKSRRTKMEWRDRWVIIHRGMLNICKHRLVSPSAHVFISSPL